METKKPVGRTDLLGDRSDLLNDAGGARYDLWGDLSYRIGQGQVVPVLSNAVVNNRIFDISLPVSADRGAKDQDEEHQCQIEEQLATRWARYLQYPLAETPLELSRVAQYNRIQSRYPDVAKRKYLTFLKLYLLDLAASDASVEDVQKAIVRPLRGKGFDEMMGLLDDSFSEIAFQLNHPRFESEQRNPLHLLAQLPLPVYVTTSHHDFLERALEVAGKYPQVQICYWFGPEGAEHPEAEWFVDPPDLAEATDEERAIACPMVYHLYGLEKEPSSLVISEDDYMEFLVRVSRDWNSVPLPLRTALSQSSILLLGYRLRCWDFRVLFRGVIHRIIRSRKQEGRPKPNVALQLDPPVQLWDKDPKWMPEHERQARNYLIEYFEDGNFGVVWDSTAGFALRLLQRWQGSTS